MIPGGKAEREEYSDAEPLLSSSSHSLPFQLSIAASIATSTLHDFIDSNDLLFLTVPWLGWAVLGSSCAAFLAGSNHLTQ